MIFYFNWQSEKKNYFGPIRSCFLFQLLKLREIRGKNWGNKLVKSSHEFNIDIEMFDMFLLISR